MKVNLNARRGRRRDHGQAPAKDAAGTLPFKEQLTELLSGIADSNLVGCLQILSCLTAITTTLATGFLAVAYIETMKTYKKAEYEGQPLPDLKEIFAEQKQQLMEFINQVCVGECLPGLVDQSYSLACKSF